jgi:hypothetical protein
VNFDEGLVIEELLSSWFENYFQQTKNYLRTIKNYWQPLRVSKNLSSRTTVKPGKNYKLESCSGLELPEIVLRGREWLMSETPVKRDQKRSAA